MIKMVVVIKERFILNDITILDYKEQTFYNGINWLTLKGIISAVLK